jgi:hypothetical protein
VQGAHDSFFYNYSDIAEPAIDKTEHRRNGYVILITLRQQRVLAPLLLSSALPLLPSPLLPSAFV